jgi:hypothetical protein
MIRPIDIREAVDKPWRERQRPTVAGGWRACERGPSAPGSHRRPILGSPARSRRPQASPLRKTVRQRLPCR